MRQVLMMVLLMVMIVVVILNDGEQWQHCHRVREWWWHPASQNRACFIQYTR